MTEPSLDHIVVAAPDVDHLVRSFHDRTGVEPVLGGRHESRGTRNHLVSLGGMAYLELIGPDDPEAPGPLPSVFGIDHLAEPRVAAWKVRSSDIEATVAAARASGYDPGAVSPLSRRTPDGALLEWRLTQDPPTDYDGLVPGLIDWQDSPHPTSAGLPEVRLVALAGQHPQADAVRNALDALDVELDLREGEAGLDVILDTPNGEVHLR